MQAISIRTGQLYPLRQTMFLVEGPTRKKPVRHHLEDRWDCSSPAIQGYLAHKKMPTPPGTLGKGRFLMREVPL